MATLQELNAGLTGRYEIEREIGAGGMATVYLARDVRHERQVAIKVLREDLSASLGKDRFLREIKLAAALQHPHVLPLFDSGEANGLLFYVMPFVDGISLRQRLVREGELPVSDAARILRDVADALSEAHKHGIVHRDLKPENVMLRGRHALVTDFGVAKALSEATGRQSLTTVGIALGTPTYMSPEQAVADPHVDQRADIYAFGVMAYEMLTGHPPFVGLNPQQVLAAHVTSAPEAIGARRATIPPALAALVMKCLEKKPADRWQTADEVVPMLESVLTPSGGMTPTETKPHGAVAAAAPPARRSTRGLAIAAAALLVAAIAGGGAWMWRGRTGGGAANDKSIAILPFEDISGDTANRAFILGMHGEIVTQMTKLPGVQVASRQSSSGYLGSRKPVQSIAKELGVARILTGTLQRAGGQIHVQAELQDASNGRPLWADSYNQELTTANLFAIEGEVARKVASSLSVTVSDAAAAELSKAPTKSIDALDLYHRGELLWSDRGTPGRDTLAPLLLARAVELDSSFVQAWALLSMTRSYLLRLGAAFDTLPARQALDRAVALAPHALEARVASGYYRYYAKADYAGALEDIKEAERSSPRSSELSALEALLLRRLARYDEAFVAETRALELDPRSLIVRQDLAQLNMWLGRYDEAAAIADEARRQSPNSPNALQYAVYARLAKGDTASAAAVLAASRSHVEPTDAALLDVPFALRRHDLNAAMAAIRKSAYGFVSSDGNSSGDYRQAAYAALAVLSRLAGDATAARRFADSALAIGSALKAKTDRRFGDPFGNGALADMHSATALAAIGDTRAVPLAEAAARRFNIKVDGADGPSMSRMLALVYTLANRPHDAVAQLKIATSVPINLSIADLRLSALYDPLRNDPEFKALIAGGRGS